MEGEKKKKKKIAFLLKPLSQPTWEPCVILCAKVRQKSRHDQEVVRSSSEK